MKEVEPYQNLSEETLCMLLEDLAISLSVVRTVKTGEFRQFHLDRINYLLPRLEPYIYETQESQQGIYQQEGAQDED